MMSRGARAGADLDRAPLRAAAPDRHRRGRPHRGRGRPATRPRDAAAGHRPPARLRRHPLARLPARPPRRGRDLSRRARQLLDLARGDVRAGRLARPRDASRALARRRSREMRDAGITTVGEFHYVHHEREGDFALDEAVLEAAARRRDPDRAARTATTRPARPGRRSRAPSAASPPRRWTGSGGRWTGWPRALDPRHPDAGRRAAQHPGGEPERDRGASTTRPRRRGLPVPHPRRGAAAGDRGVDRRLRPHARWR